MSLTLMDKALLGIYHLILSIPESPVSKGGKLEVLKHLEAHGVDAELPQLQTVNVIADFPDHVFALPHQFDLAVFRLCFCPLVVYAIGIGITDNAVLIDVDLRGANLHGASFKDALLVNVDLRDTNLVRTEMQGVSLVACDTSGSVR